jgi:Arc/MetJ-type ribon-helix-helix transcriptional regulator
MPKSVYKLQAKRGRPATGNVQISVRLPVEVIEKLARLTKNGSYAFLSRSQVITKLVMTAPEELAYTNERGTLRSGRSKTRRVA